MIAFFAAVYFTSGTAEEEFALLCSLRLEEFTRER